MRVLLVKLSQFCNEMFQNKNKFSLKSEKPFDLFINFFQLKVMNSETICEFCS